MRRIAKLALESLELRTLFNVDTTALVGPIAVASYSIDGTGNNLSNTNWGAAGTDLLRTAAAQYADGLSAPAGSTRPMLD